MVAAHSKAVSLIAVLLSCGCAASPPLPAAVNLSDARPAYATTSPPLRVDATIGNKAGGAAAGAGTGLSTGVLVGGLACLAAGPLLPLCLVGVVPVTAGVGTATGAVVGAVRAESGQEIEAKGNALRDTLSNPGQQTRLASLLKDNLRDKFALDLPMAIDGNSWEQVEGAAARRWELNLSLSEVGTEGRRDFQLRFIGRIDVRATDAESPNWFVAKEVQSETELTLSQWTANDARALTGVVDVCLRTLANRLANDLVRAPSGSARYAPRIKYSTSCDDQQKDWEPRPN